MLRSYVLGSQSLCFDQRTMFDPEARYADTHRDLLARVLLSIGRLPNPRTLPGSASFRD